jgi:SAM-dependent MidA family methyltransferase
MQHDHNTGLPEPDADARRLSEQLVELIRDDIDKNSGWISFARYMELALYAPGFGYYATGTRKFGEAGDFVTAPEISELFPGCLARQCRQILQALGNGHDGIIEFGAGSGVMAAGILKLLAAAGEPPGQYTIIEISPALRERQRETLAQHVPELLPTVHWLAQLPGRFRGVMLANEVLDAMPVHRLRISPQGLQELGVTWQAGFEWALRDLPAPLVEAVATLPGLTADNYTTELSLAVPAWVSTVAESLDAGAVLLMDYGYDRREYYRPDRVQGTLACHYRHRRHEDPFLLPGLQDITAHVDFSSVAEAADAAGLMVAGYTTQAQFLLALGITELLANVKVTNTVRQIQMAHAVKQLTLPGEMGELVKAMALTKKLDLSLCGFSGKDLRSRL